MTAQNCLCRGLVLWDTKDMSSAHWPRRSGGDLCPSVCSLCISSHVPHGRKQLQSPTLPNFGCPRAESQGTESALSIPTPCSSTVGCWSQCGAAPLPGLLGRGVCGPKVQCWRRIHGASLVPPEQRSTWHPPSGGEGK